MFCFLNNEFSQEEISFCMKENFFYWKSLSHNFEKLIVKPYEYYYNYFFDTLLILYYAFFGRKIFLHYKIFFD